MMIHERVDAITHSGKDLEIIVIEKNGDKERGFPVRLEVSEKAEIIIIEILNNFIKFLNK
jgi:hypothetical protein